jgi:hypothetical protein
MGSSDVLLGKQPGISVPHDHIGPYFLAGLGRTIWWTGRVAIGLRYEPARDSRAAGGVNEAVAGSGPQSAHC